MSTLKEMLNEIENEKKENTSPYYKDHHFEYKKAIRRFVEEELRPHAFEWDEAKKVPEDIKRKAFAAGILPGVVGPPWPTAFIGRNIAGGVLPEQFDAFHELILQDELARLGSAGVQWALQEGLAIGLPPVLHFGSPYLQQKVVGPCLRGEKVICLAIT